MHSLFGAKFLLCTHLYVVTIAFFLSIPSASGVHCSSFAFDLAYGSFDLRRHVALLPTLAFNVMHDVGALGLGWDWRDCWMARIL